MGKILNLVKEHFYNEETGFADSFDCRDFERVTGIDSKVAAMNLKKYANKEVLGSFSSGDGLYSTIYYIYRTDDEINEAVDKVNYTIDKYDLKQPKLKRV